MNSSPKYHLGVICFFLNTFLLFQRSAQKLYMLLMFIKNGERNPNEVQSSKKFRIPYFCRVCLWVITHNSISTSIGVLVVNKDKMLQLQQKRGKDW